MFHKESENNSKSIYRSVKLSPFIQHLMGVMTGILRDHLNVSEAVLRGFVVMGLQRFQEMRNAFSLEFDAPGLPLETRIDAALDTNACICGVLAENLVSEKDLPNLKSAIQEADKVITDAIRAHYPAAH